MDHTWLIGLGIFAAVMVLVFLPTLIENVVGGLILLLLSPLLKRWQGQQDDDSRPQPAVKQHRR